MCVASATISGLSGAAADMQHITSGGGCSRLKVTQIRSGRVGQLTSVTTLPTAADCFPANLFQPRPPSVPRPGLQQQASQLTLRLCNSECDLHAATAVMSRLLADKAGISTPYDVSQSNCQPIMTARPAQLSGSAHSRVRLLVDCRRRLAVEVQLHVMYGPTVTCRIQRAPS